MSPGTRQRGKRIVALNDVDQVTLDVVDVLGSERVRTDGSNRLALEAELVDDILDVDGARALD
ncbi:MAG: hypothetical protein R3D67_03630 [Hyphomicrobiaceae bacterium]